MYEEPGQLEVVLLKTFYWLTSALNPEEGRCCYDCVSSARRQRGFNEFSCEEKMLEDVRNQFPLKTNSYFVAPQLQRCAAIQVSSCRVEMKWCAWKHHCSAGKIFLWSDTVVTIQLALERALIVFYTQANEHFFQANERREECCADEVNFHPWTFSSPQKKVVRFFSLMSF